MDTNVKFELFLKIKNEIRIQLLFLFPEFEINSIPILKKLRLSTNLNRFEKITKFITLTLDSNVEHGVMKN